jgi:guanine deaminase
MAATVEKRIGEQCAIELEAPTKKMRTGSSCRLAKVFRGTVIHSVSMSKVDVLEDAVLGVTLDGKVAFLEDKHTESLGVSLALRTGETFDLSDVNIVTLPKRGFVVPGFCDVHTHAPQFKFAGLGYDMQLLQWLETYTFPNEAQWKDAQHAKRVATNAVRRTLANGTTSAVWFATIHTDAALLLAEIAHAHCQRAFVGKVNMDRNSPDFYCETTSESLSETKRFVETMLAKPDAALAPRPMPVITPRFVPTCTSELMTGLAAIAAKHDLLIQSHVSENQGEIEWVKALHPDESSYTGVYDSMGLLTAKTILAHGVYLGADERKLMAAKRSVVAHCPLSNLQLRSGMCDVRRLLNDGVPVALGTDVSGGASPSMLSAIREACKVSNMVSVTGDGSRPLSYAEAFHLATVGGAKALSTPGLTGNFTLGADFDAVVVDPDATGTAIDLYDDEGALDAFQKWLQLGDDRNTTAVFVRGATAIFNTSYETLAKKMVPEMPFSAVSTPSDIIEDGSSEEMTA